LPAGRANSGPWVGFERPLRGGEREGEIERREIKRKGTDGTGEKYTLPEINS